MSEKTSSKRKLETDEAYDPKKLKIESLSNEDLENLKNELKADISKEFDDKISELKKEIEELKRQYGSPKEAAPDKEERKHVFGTSLIKLKPNSNTATPQTSFTSVREKTPKDISPSESSHVFGAVTSFGTNSAFENIKNKKNVFDDLSSKTAKNDSSGESPNGATPTASFGSAFGSNSKFNNAFLESLKKKSFLDEPNDNQNNKEKSAGLNTQQYKQVDLNPVGEIKTGEEDEESKFSATAKIFELDLTKISEGWKERGIGPIHLNVSLKDSNQVRLVMRSQGLLKVILNMKIKPDTKLLKGLEASLSPGKFLRFNFINAEGNPNQYLLKFGSQSLRDELFDKVEDLQNRMGNTNGTNRE